MGNVLSCDASADKIYKHDGFSSTILDSFASPSTSPEEVEWAVMPATLATYLYTGSTPTGEAISELILNTQDNNDESAIRIPISGSHYSFWKHVALYLEDWGDSNQVSNIKFYCDGSIDWDGCILKCAEVTNYDQATGVVGESGDEASANHTDNPTMVNVENYTQDSPLSLTGSTTTTGKAIDGYLLLQLEVTSSASLGDLPPEILCWRYDLA